MNPELDKQKAQSVEQETRDSELEFAKDLFANDGRMLDLYFISNQILSEYKKTDKSLAERIAIDIIIGKDVGKWAYHCNLQLVEESLLDYALMKIATEVINNGYGYDSLEYEIAIKNLVSEKLVRETNKLKEQIENLPSNLPIWV